MTKFVAEFCAHQEYEEAPMVHVAEEDWGRWVLDDTPVKLTAADRESRQDMLSTAEMALREHGWFIPDGDEWEDGDNSYFATVERRD